ncbi:MAG: pyroglutamyl-peptidase I [Planctomycetota bacterium]|nr:pyroglutamyl-peptidase I [Planctomycetota bacterium]
MSYQRSLFFSAILCIVAMLSLQARGQDDDPAEPSPATSPDSPQPVVLLTGFGPFGSHSKNPSWIGAKGVNGKVIEGHKVVSVELPVDYRKVWQRVPELIKEHNPAVVIHFGVFMNGPLRFERQARNSIGTLNDVAGYHPEDGRVVEDGPMIYESRLPEAELLDQMPKANFEMIASEDAGRYVCEFTFFTEIYFQEKLGKRSSAGFIHVAPLNRPLSARKLKKAMAKAVEIVLKKRAADKAAEEAAEDAIPTSRPAGSEIEADAATARSRDTNAGPENGNPSSGSNADGSASSGGIMGALRGRRWKGRPGSNRRAPRRGPR